MSRILQRSINSTNSFKNQQKKVPTIAKEVISDSDTKHENIICSTETNSTITESCRIFRLMLCVCYLRFISSIDFSPC